MIIAFNWILIRITMLDTLESHSLYLVRLFLSKLSVDSGADAPAVAAPIGMTMTVMADYELAAATLNTAYRTPGMCYVSFQSSNNIFL
jgi:hypothetical protein